MLKVDEYNLREQQAISELPNRIIEMVNPVVFQSEGYPSRVRQESELWKYLDVNHETRFERDFSDLIDGGLTDQEFELFKQVVTITFDFSKTFFGRKLSTRSSLLRALNVYRHINDIFVGSPGSVLEIGPGSGYLGCLMYLSGWRYAATDISQAFYLLQHNLWNHLAKGTVRELLDPAEHVDTLNPGEIAHIPWWIFYQLRNDMNGSVDIVTCNHALAEMHPNSLAYTLLMARNLLRGGGKKLFIFEGWGFEKFTLRSKITELFYQYGFRLVHNDSKIHIFILSDNEYAHPYANLPKLPGLRKIFVTQIKRSLGFPNIPVDSVRFWPLEFNNEQNTISRSVLEGREKRRNMQLFGIEKMNEFYKTLFQSTDYRTQDEQFLALIGKTY